MTLTSHQLNTLLKRLRIHDWQYKTVSDLSLEIMTSLLWCYRLVFHVLDSNSPLTTTTLARCYEYDNERGQCLLDQMQQKTRQKIRWKVTNPTVKHPPPPHHKLNVAHTVTEWMDKYLSGLNDTGKRNTDLYEEILGSILIPWSQVKNPSVTLCETNPISIRETDYENMWKRYLLFLRGTKLVYF